LIPLLAWELPGGNYGERVQPSGELRQVWRNLACRRLQDALLAVWGETPDDPLVQPHVERGAAGWVLVNLACRPGDVLIVGAGRRGALARMVFSKVSRYCLAHARCPILAIPPPALARELAHSRFAWAFWHRPPTPEQILRDQPKPTA
jgi:nucleotide-binding universal stress UspA family protein